MTYELNQALSYQSENTQLFFLYTADGSQVYGNTPVNEGTYYWAEKQEKEIIHFLLTNTGSEDLPTGDFEVNRVEHPELVYIGKWAQSRPFDDWGREDWSDNIYVDADNYIKYKDGPWGREYTLAFDGGGVVYANHKIIEGEGFIWTNG